MVKLVASKELAFQRSNPRGLLPPPTIPNIEVVEFAKLLGVFVMATLGAGKQMEYILQIRNQRLYLLNQLKKQELVKRQLLNVCNAIVISRITYAASWRWFASPAECNSIQIFLSKVNWWRITTEDTSVDVLEAVDYNLFNKSQYSNK